jgi:hypothetical protein
MIVLMHYAANLCTQVVASKNVGTGTAVRLALLVGSTEEHIMILFGLSVVIAAFE